MTLSIITQEQLLNKRNDENSWDIVMLTHEDCGACADWETLVDGIKDNYSTITFSKLVVSNNDIPLFAPPILPSIIALHNGSRLWESLGSMTTTTNLENMIDEWLEGRINFDTISGGTSVHEFS